MLTSRKSSPARGTKCTAFFSPRSVDLGHKTKDTFFPPKQAEESESQAQSRVGASTHFLASPSTSTALPAFVLSAFFFSFFLWWVELEERKEKYWMISRKGTHQFEYSPAIQHSVLHAWPRRDGGKVITV